MSSVDDIRLSLIASFGTINMRLNMLRYSPTLTPMLPEFNMLENALVSLKQKFINQYGNQLTVQQRTDLDNVTGSITQRIQALAGPPPPAPAAGGGRKKRQTRKTRKSKK